MNDFPRHPNDLVTRGVLLIVAAFLAWVISAIGLAVIGLKQKLPSKRPFLRILAMAGFVVLTVAGVGIFFVGVLFAGCGVAIGN